MNLLRFFLLLAEPKELGNIAQMPGSLFSIGGKLFSLSFAWRISNPIKTFGFSL